MKFDASSLVSQERQLTKAPSSTKYHLAAIDGYVDMLCDASKKETNLMNEENGLTPTLLAALSGQLDALRILVGRGGDPEKAAHDGSTALHLAASRNHLNCASFLVNFGVNMWALDNELHTAKDVAALGDKKEVLDYLDQMMAKQSALNTKNVQKLKEKAKVAAEKRLKQQRKAQLKAIKQVERDERYLMKLSNNRRLLRGAHSIGDIKLVGRGHHHPDLASRISFTPSEASSSNSSSGSSSRDQPVVRPGGSRLSGKAPSISNLISHKIQMDILGRPRSKLNLSDADSSAYSCSSVSSVSYLSNCSAGVNSIKDHLAPRPKYSDLVAVNETEAAARLNLASSNLTKKETQFFRSKDQRPNPSPEQQSLKSSTAGTIASKLWGVSGVSRKVHLRRMLQANNAQSTNDLSTVPDDEPDMRSRLKGRQTTGIEEQHGRVNISRSTMNLDRVSHEDEKSAPSAEHPSSNRTQKGADPNEQSSIKWPPAPAMTRAVSEPDFGAMLHSPDNEDHGGDGAHDDEITSRLHENLEAKQPEDPHTKTVPHFNDPDKSDREAGGTHESLRRADSPAPDNDQHRLLTQCLSQLKLRHEAITKQQNQEDSETRQQSQQAPHKATRDCSNNQPMVSQALFGANSDELIQHQLNAGQFPLRPSAIKQQQRTNCLAACTQQKQEQPKVITSTCNRARVSAESVDSIGSASSFAKRNSRPPSTSSISSATTNTASTSCNSCPKHTQDSNSFSGSSSSSSSSCEPIQETSLETNSLDKRDVLLCEAGITHCLNEGEDNEENIETFLMSAGLLDLSSVFAKEKIDVEALMLLTEDDLKSLNILLGPRRKLLKAINSRRSRLNKYTIASKYVMVDTQL